MCIFTVSVLVTIMSGGIILGCFLLLKPAQAIRFQQKFYEKINWRITPISMKREIRNTKIMGILLLVMVFLAAGYLVIKRLNFS